jgi:hypothetical protein
MSTKSEIKAFIQEAVEYLADNYGDAPFCEAAIAMAREDGRDHYLAESCSAEEFAELCAEFAELEAGTI